MTNETDLFQPEFPQLALPAATAMVFVDGTLREDLAPVEIVRCGWPEFGWARLLYHPVVCQDATVLCSEQIEERFGMGTRIDIRRLYNGTPPDAAVHDLPLFAGQIESIETTVGDNGEQVEIVAKDFSAMLRRISVHGQRMLNADGSTAMLAGFETVFNPLGQGNASVEKATRNGRARPAFCANATRTREWTCAEAIDYLLSEYVPDSLLYRPTAEQLLALTANRLLPELDVTGLNLLEALQQCCEAAGIQFQFAPRIAETDPSQAITFYRNGQGRAVELNCQQGGEPLSLSRTNVGTLHSERAFYPITNRYIGQGEFKVYEATFDLVKAWDPALEGTSYYDFGISTNPDFDKVRDVYRRWCLNEAGDYTSEPYNQRDAYDFSAIFEHAAYAHRRRQFLPPLSAGPQGELLDCLLEVSWDHGQQWSEYIHTFDVLSDECGIWLSKDQLDMETWVAGLQGAVRFRITASVVSDERLTWTVADGPVGSTIPVVDHLLTSPRSFAYRRVSGHSVFAHTAGASTGMADEADDSAALRQFVRDRAAVASPSVIEDTEIQTLSLLLHYDPGDRITCSPDSRDLLNCRRDNRSTTWIDRIHMDFVNQRTNLRLVRRRLGEL